MVEVFDGLRALPEAMSGEPESLDGLRARGARRRARRQRRGLALALTTVVAGLGVAAGLAGDDPADDDVSAGPPTQPTSVGVDVVVAGPTGVVVVGPDGGVTPIWDQPAAGAFAIEGGPIIAQAADPSGEVYPNRGEGPIVELADGDVRELPLEGDEALELHDAAVIDGRIVALATSRTGMSPDDNDERLLLVDVASGTRQDLGSVGGWEAGVSQAIFVGDRIALSLGGAANMSIQLSDLTGRPLWTVELGVDQPVPVLVAADGQLLGVEGRFVGDALAPVLQMTTIDLGTGRFSETTSRTLVPKGDLRIGTGFCMNAEWTGTGLLCDLSSGGPLLVDPGTGATRRFGRLDGGVPSLTRPFGAAD